MNTFVVEVFLSLPKVTFYTVRWDEQNESETDRFLFKYNGKPQQKSQLQDLVNLINEIGEHRGAKQIYFDRSANEASELPPKRPITIDNEIVHFQLNQLRLFCNRISDQIVVLFNGGLKTSQKTQDSEDLSMKFREAQVFSRKIWNSIKTKDIIVQEHLLLNPNGGEILLY